MTLLRKWILARNVKYEKLVLMRLIMMPTFIEHLLYNRHDAEWQMLPTTLSSDTHLTDEETETGH